MAGADAKEFTRVAERRPDADAAVGDKAEEDGAVATLERSGVQVAMAGASTPPDVFDLHRHAGNRAVARSLTPQFKLEVGAADDKHEREADKVADTVVKTIRRMKDPDRVGPDDGLDDDTRIRRAIGRTAEAEVGEEGGEISTDVNQEIRRSRGSGIAIEAGTRTKLESAFGADFSGVRIHRDSPIAPKLGAKAFTLGSDVHFAPGNYDTASTSGQKLLSHELTHVIQQTGGITRDWDGSEPAAAVEVSADDADVVRRRDEESTGAGDSSSADSGGEGSGAGAAVGGDDEFWTLTGDGGNLARAAGEVGRLVPVVGLLTGGAADTIEGYQLYASLENIEGEHADITTALMMGRQAAVMATNVVDHISYLLQLIQDGCLGSVVGAELVAATGPLNIAVSAFLAGMTTGVTLIDAFLVGWTAASAGMTNDPAAQEAYGQLALGFGVDASLGLIQSIMALVDVFSAGLAHQSTAGNVIEAAGGVWKGWKALDDIILATADDLVDLFARLASGAASKAFVKESAETVLGLLMSGISIWGGGIWEDEVGIIRQIPLAFVDASEHIFGLGVAYNTMVIDLIGMATDEVYHLGEDILGGQDPFTWMRDQLTEAIRSGGENIEQLLHVGEITDQLDEHGDWALEQIDALIAQINGIAMPQAEAAHTELGDNLAADALEWIVDSGAEVAAAATNTFFDVVGGMVDELKGPAIEQLEALKPDIEYTKEFLELFRVSINEQVAGLRGQIDRFAELLGECESVEDIFDVILGAVGEAMGIPNLSIEALRAIQSEVESSMQGAWAWVREQAEAFAGDPDHPMVFGAGGETTQTESNPAEEEEEEIQPKAAPGGLAVGAEGGELSPELTSEIGSSQGQPLQDDVRIRMESAFGTPLSHVRIHQDSKIAPRIGATAFTKGSDVHFAPGTFQPFQPAGQKLLAHELTHVVQQTGGVARQVSPDVVRRKAGDGGDGPGTAAEGEQAEGNFPANLFAALQQEIGENKVEAPPVEKEPAEPEEKEEGEEVEAEAPSAEEPSAPEAEVAAPAPLEPLLPGPIEVPQPAMPTESFSVLPATAPDAVRSAIGHLEMVMMSQHLGIDAEAAAQIARLRSEGKRQKSAIQQAALALRTEAMASFEQLRADINSTGAETKQALTDTSEANKTRIRQGAQTQADRIVNGAKERRDGVQLLGEGHGVNALEHGQAQAERMRAHGLEKAAEARQIGEAKVQQFKGYDEADEIAKTARAMAAETAREVTQQADEVAGVVLADAHSLSQKLRDDAAEYSKNFAVDQDVIDGIWQAADGACEKIDEAYNQVILDVDTATTKTLEGVDRGEADVMTQIDGIAVSMLPGVDAATTAGVTAVERGAELARALLQSAMGEVVDEAAQVGPNGEVAAAEFLLGLDPHLAASGDAAMEGLRLTADAVIVGLSASGDQALAQINGTLPAIAAQNALILGKYSDQMKEAKQTAVDKFVSAADTTITDLTSKAGEVITELDKAFTEARDSLQTTLEEGKREITTKVDQASAKINEEVAKLGPAITRKADELEDASWWDKVTSALGAFFRGFAKAFVNFLKGIVTILKWVAIAIVILVVVIALVAAIFGLGGLMTLLGGLLAIFAALKVLLIVAAVVGALIAILTVYKTIVICMDPNMGWQQKWEAIGGATFEVIETIGPTKILKALKGLKGAAGLGKLDDAADLAKLDDAADLSKLDDAGDAAKLDEAAVSKPKPKPEAEAEAPKPKPKPEAEAPKPKPEGPKPKPEAEAPKPKPKPEAEAPKPKPEGPKPKPEAEGPKPKPEAEAPAPKPGDALPDEVLSSHYGVPPEKASRLKKDFASQHKVKIWARPSTPHAPTRLAEGAVPKIESVKAKTLSEVDLKLGKFDDGDLGKVAYFKPELPPRPKDMPDSEWKVIQDRFNQRKAEYDGFKDEMAYLSKDPKTRGPKPKESMREPGNDQIRVDDKGIVEVVDPSTGKGTVMTGDIDLYQVSKADGTPFKTVDTPSGPKNEYDDLMERLVENDLIEHGEHLGWRTRSPKEASIKQGIMEKHAGGEHLVEFSPGGRATLAKADDVPGHTKQLDDLKGEAPGAKPAEAGAPKSQAEQPKAEAEQPKAEAEGPKPEAEQPKAPGDDVGAKPKPGDDAIPPEVRAVEGKKAGDLSEAPPGTEFYTRPDSTKGLRWKSGHKGDRPSISADAEGRITFGNAAGKTEAPRLKPGEPFDKTKRRPDFNDFNDVETKPAFRSDGSGGGGDARVRVYEERIPDRFAKERAEIEAALETAKGGKDRGAVGHKFERNQVEDMKAADAEGKALREIDSTTDKTRIGDIMGREITIEGANGPFSSGKLDQLWRDLNIRGEVHITVPKLSPQAQKQLEKLVAIHEKVSGTRAKIVVREALPDLKGTPSKADLPGSGGAAKADELLPLPDDLHVTTPDGPGVKYSPVTDPGPIAKHAGNFRGGSYTEITLERPITLYRVHGGQAGELGPWWTRTKPSGPLQSQMDSALLKEWGNEATQVAEIEVPAGTKIYEGAAGPQASGPSKTTKSDKFAPEHLEGGGNQVYIPFVESTWLKSGQ